MPEAVIVSTARSPIGRAVKGSLATMRPDDLVAQMVRAALDKVPALDPRDIDDLMMGCAQPAGEAGYNIARAVAVELGYDFLPGTTVNRYCSSSLQTTRMAFHAIKAGEGDVFISAGVETVSRFGVGAADGARTARTPSSTRRRSAPSAQSAGAEEWHDPREDGNIPDVYIAMGQTAENVALCTGISREDQDHWGVRSQNRAEEAIKSGFFEREIVPVTLPDGTVVSTDDGPRAGTTYEGISQLKPVFRPNGTITAGNACPLNDGGAAVVIMSDTKAKELGLTPLARIVSTGVSGLSPEIMGLGPIEAIKKALGNAGMPISDIDLFEINEAFAVQVLGSARALGIDEDKLNVSGGAIALGHPFGMTGARITATLLNNLDHPGQDVRHRVDVRRRRPGHGDGRGAAHLDWLLTETAVNAATRPERHAHCEQSRGEQEGPARHGAGPSCGLAKLVVLEVTEQTQDLDVQPDQRDGQAERNAPRRLLGRSRTDHLIGGIEVEQEAERRQADAHQREDDRQRTARTQAQAVTAADVEHRQHEVAEHQHQRHRSCPRPPCG